MITLTTDFGYEDPFVGIMKGIIFGICPEANVVDLTHGVGPQDLVAGALALEAARPWFPDGTIHVAVVDPGVGTDRELLAVATGREIYVAPDNGLLSFLPETEIREIRAVVNPEFMLHPVSRTFHGRDVVAPAAANLASGVPMEQLGPRRVGMERLPFPVLEKREGEVRGEVIGFDRFGNGITSIRERDLLPAESVTVFVNESSLPLAATYADVPVGAGLSLIGSTGRLEISVREGSARDAFRLRRGDPVVLRSSRYTPAVGKATGSAHPAPLPEYCGGSKKKVT